MVYASTIHAVAGNREQEYLEGWKRDRAQMQNMRRQAQEAITSGSVRARQDVIEQVLPVADNFRATIMHVPEGIEQDAWVQGVIHVARQFDQILESLGVSIINPAGAAFNPHEHEAVEQVEGSEESGQVVAVLQVGYKVGDAVLRPARVKVQA